MVEQKPKAVNRITGPTALRRPEAVAAALTPKEVYSILRRHLWLIIILTILGLVIAGATWFFLRRFYPKYTAETYIRVLTPVQQDPKDIKTTRINRDLEYGFTGIKLERRSGFAVLPGLMKTERLQIKTNAI
jgi:hypothetical protein